MPTNNADIARLFNRVADLLEIADANAFRVRAYRNAARTLDDQSQSIAEMIEGGADLSELPEIGNDLAGKIEEIVKTGSLKLLEELEEQVPGELAELLKVKQLGPKRAGALHRHLNISSLDDLAQAAKDRKISELEGFGT